ncbi:MAG: DUF2239 family protein, partial [Caulobacteraceae bacterium]|nr:DUF2239 family protein [Caulobacteraceae bacterium]
MSEPAKTVTAFADFRQLASGGRDAVAGEVRQAIAASPTVRILVLDDQTGSAVDLDLR